MQLLSATLRTCSVFIRHGARHLRDLQKNSSWCQQTLLGGTGFCGGVIRKVISLSSARSKKTSFMPQCTTDKEEIYKKIRTNHHISLYIVKNYAPAIIASMSVSTVPIGLISNFSTSMAVTFGVRNSGSVGPRRIPLTPR